ncbi:MAG: DNA/RNA nuclease SfsA [Planctomycetota bacterium]|nr:DNA/RNA nuclease SfsA [Planctomycetota bacterium]
MAHLDYRYPGPLESGVLLRRMKRFLADVRLDDGQELRVHCPNPGSMLGCAEPGQAVRVRDTQDPRRKLRYGLEQVRAGRAWIGVHPGLANHVIAAALERRGLPGLEGYDRVRREVGDGHASRLDFLVEGAAGRCWIEVKSTTLRVGREGRFPDARSARGLKHLEALAALRAAGDRAVIVYLVQRADVDLFRPAAEIDPAYAEGLVRAHAAGVEVLPIRAQVTARGIGAGPTLPYDLSHA